MSAKAFQLLLVFFAAKFLPRRKKHSSLYLKKKSQIIISYGLIPCLIGFCLWAHLRDCPPLSIHRPAVAVVTFIQKDLPPVPQPQTKSLYIRDLAWRPRGATYPYQGGCGEVEIAAAVGSSFLHTRFLALVFVERLWENRSLFLGSAIDPKTLPKNSICWN